MERKVCVRRGGGEWNGIEDGVIEGKECLRRGWMEGVDS